MDNELLLKIMDLSVKKGATHIDNHPHIIRVQTNNDGVIEYVRYDIVKLLIEKKDL